MQKNRNAVAAGILALALVVGGFALYSNRTAQKAPETTAHSEIDEPSTAASANPDDTDTTDTTTNTDNTTGDTKTTDTPAATTDNKTTTTGSTTSKTTVPETYTVMKGDTLRDIAKKYYGDPVYAGDIERVNELPDANSIPVGKVLKMPRPDELNNTTNTNTDTKTEQNDTKADTTPTH